MTSLKEWFDSLSEDTRKYLSMHCDWIDTNNDDYYKRIELTDSYFSSMIERADRAYRSEECCKSLILGLIIKLRDKDPTTFKDILSDKTLKLLINKTSNGVDKLFLFSPFLQKEITKEKLKDNNDLSLEQLLYITDDYSNIDYKRLSDRSLKYNSVTREIFGLDACIELAKENIDFIKVSLSSLDPDDELIDTLFFGENQLSTEQKINLIKYMYNPDTSDIEDYMKRFVTVNEYYLKYIYDIIRQDPAVAAKLYNLKKPECELSGNETTAMKYRYPKKYRKLFQMAACCARKNVGKAMAGTIGELASMLKMYNWDFYTLFDCMYADLIENESDESEETEVLES